MHEEQSGIVKACLSRICPLLKHEKINLAWTCVVTSSDHAVVDRAQMWLGKVHPKAVMVRQRRSMVAMAAEAAPQV